MTPPPASSSQRRCPTTRCRVPTRCPCSACTVEIPRLTNPLGMKGVGESGAVAAPPAVINAVLDALATLGVEGIDMPATSDQVWAAISQHPGDHRLS